MSLSDSSTRKFKIILLIFFFFILIISCLKPVYPAEMFLQHSVTLIMSILLIVITVKNTITDKSFLLVASFLLLHVIGARWIYSYVPYEEWFSFAGDKITGIIHTERNNYDRFVHLMFGLMMFYPFREIAERWFGYPSRFSPLAALLVITGCSMFYEVFEWILTLVLSPEDAENYNGQQGDIWDAQKDMALALAGALVNFLTVVGKRMIYRRKN